MISKDEKTLQAQATFSLIYVIQKGKLKKDGTAPILARITINGKTVSEIRVDGKDFFRNWADYDRKKDPVFNSLIEKE